jgi:hypothetical protein
LKVNELIDLLKSYPEEAEVKLLVVEDREDQSSLLHELEISDIFMAVSENCESETEVVFIA